MFPKKSTMKYDRISGISHRWDSLKKFVPSSGYFTVRFSGGCPRKMLDLNFAQKIQKPVEFCATSVTGEVSHLVTICRESKFGADKMFAKIQSAKAAGRVSCYSGM